MIREAFVELDTSFGGGFNQMNPAARRFRLQLQGAIGRTLIQTEAAMNALVELGEIERRDFCAGAALLFMCVQRQMSFLIQLKTGNWKLETHLQIHSPAGICPGCRRISPQVAGVGKSFAGLNLLSGSKARRTRAMACRSASLKRRPI